MGHCDSCAVFYCHTWCWTFREYSSIQFAVYLLSQAELSEACVQLFLWPNTPARLCFVHFKVGSIGYECHSFELFCRFEQLKLQFSGINISAISTFVDGLLACSRPERIIIITVINLFGFYDLAKHRTPCAFRGDNYF